MKTKSNIFYTLAGGLIGMIVLTSCQYDFGINNGSKKYNFKNDVVLRYTPMKCQGQQSLSWAYAMLAVIETEHVMMGDSVNISIDYLARHLLAEQARCHFLSYGYDRITMRATMPLLLRLIKEYGAIPYDSYNQNHLNYDALAQRMALISQASNNLSQLEKNMNRVFDERIGSLPKHVYMYGAEYTPQQFAESVCMRGEYMALTSFSHHPFGDSFALEVPDNYSDELFYNVPIDVLMKRIDTSLMHGHPVCWEGDTSEVGYSFKRGVAELYPDIKCNQQQRQLAFENRSTTDDHCMAIIGIAHDDKGRKFYIAKNSQGTDNPYVGMMYMSENYVRMKTIAIVVKNINM